ncbi:uncharacterized protein N7459_003151 [Penicillium hispanicum]|uniref:uncharacterized protein n=1 Tax=Penicillium hispanicum TaxID=1080232 RepID=UPI002541E478|nr:uncharacterized protein N7459_003151 [Penicillium hispanicum]KAJ5587386.1 hypothetical protein N7459_003151 [Penicillium hispanicum]
MPYLPTSQEFLEQSAQLLEAYPDTTRITTKYSFPTERPANQAKRQKSQSKRADASAPAETPSAPVVPVAALTLKTYNPSTGICLQYRTNKVAEVGRLMTGLGKLAGGADVASLGLSAPGVAGAGDVEMLDAPAVGDEAAPPAPAAAQNQQQGGAKGQGKGKKKGGKGKR